MHLSLVNLDPHVAVDVEARIERRSFSSVSGRILTANAIDDHNTADAPNTVEPTEFTGATLEEASLKLRLPAKSVVVLTPARGT